MIKILAFVTVLIVGCATGPNEMTSADELSNPDTICGLPTRCQGFYCYVTPTLQVVCPIGRAGSQGDADCEAACNTTNALCPQVYSQTICHQQCDGYEPNHAASVFCYASCINAESTTSCQLGQED
jgi:hypothetical protein